jgi:hypothetical protein
MKLSVEGQLGSMTRPQQGRVFWSVEIPLDWTGAFSRSRRHSVRFFLQSVHSSQNSMAVLITHRSALANIAISHARPICGCLTTWGTYLRKKASETNAAAAEPPGEATKTRNQLKRR